MNIFTFFFAHIFTIYLIHGFVFWSVGSMLCVYLSSKGFNYSLNVALVALVCYSLLALSLPILTPLVETLGKNVTINVWRHASEEPAPRRPTLYPFTKDLLLARSEEARESPNEGVDVENAEENERERVAGESAEEQEEETEEEEVNVKPADEKGKEQIIIGEGREERGESRC
jgi:hypothetical protein